jgi:hypothetical protein
MRLKCCKAFSSYDIKPPSSKWILPMFARAPIIARDLNVDHCFETLVVGHVLGSPLVAQKFLVPLLA